MSYNNFLTNNILPIYKTLNQNYQFFLGVYAVIFLIYVISGFSISSSDGIYSPILLTISLLIQIAYFTFVFLVKKPIPKNIVLGIISAILLFSLLGALWWYNMCNIIFNCITRFGGKTESHMLTNT